MKNGSLYILCPRKDDSLEHITVFILWILEHNTEKQERKIHHISKKEFSKKRWWAVIHRNRM